MTDAAAALAQSVQARLVRHASGLGMDPNLILTRYAIERFLYRLSRSPHAEQFVLKGALLMLAWLGETIRPTRDADLLGFGDLSDAALMQVFREVCAMEVEPDAMTYLSDSIRVEPIRQEDSYGGHRITLQARLGRAEIRVQVDVGIGDAVTPDPVWLEYPSLLDAPRARLRAYRQETTIAEKLHAMVVLGEFNSRMKDFFDIDALAAREPFEGRVLVDAARATFARRGTPIPSTLPLALTPAFGELGEKRAQWAGFIKKNRISTASKELGPVIDRLADFLGPVIEAARQGGAVDTFWSPGGPWRPSGGVPFKELIAIDQKEREDSKHAADTLSRLAQESGEYD